MKYKTDSLFVISLLFFSLSLLSPLPHLFTHTRFSILPSRTLSFPFFFSSHSACISPFLNSAYLFSLPTSLTLPSPLFLSRSPLPSTHSPSTPFPPFTLSSLCSSAKSFPRRQQGNRNVMWIHSPNQTQNKKKRKRMEQKCESL